MALDTIETIMNRRSIRHYKPDKIPGEHLRAILEAGRQAPSAKNLQSWHFVVVNDPQLKRKVAAACHGQHWMAEASVIIAAVDIPTEYERWLKVNTTIAMQNMILAAHSLGYGTCWIGAFDENKVSELLHVPEDKQVISLTPIGLPAVQPDARPRKDLSEIFSLNTYGSLIEPLL